ncbi:zinc finger protein 559-like [Battus philenor]|uniref:zinc finger protein 559-like n=1 Tax=Battus philenor TaxID=42288 RepID=UPI0035CF0B24
MDAEYEKVWISQPDVCRCCLSASGSSNLTVAYISDAGIKEVYHEMLQECFGISMSQLQEWGRSQLVCTQCVAQLRLSCAFKKQVLQSEKYFNLYYCQQTDVPAIEKSEKEDEIRNKNIFLNVVTNDDAASINNETSFLKSNNKKVRVRKKRRKYSERNSQTSEKETDYNSDTPIAQLARVTSHNIDDQISLQSKLRDIVLLNNCKEIIQTDNKAQKPMQRKTHVKQISERKRVKLTCGTVLRDTTACPFRHHKSWFQCFFCLKDFMEINPLREHTLSAHSDIDAELKKIKSYPRSLQIDISNLQCRKCCLTLTDVKEMCRHFDSVHDKAIYNECIADYKVDCSPFTCHICKQEFHVFRTLTTHLNEHYANCICDVCGKSFLNTRRLEVHKRTHERGDYPCEKCGKVLKTKTSKANHMESVHSNRIIKCQICTKPMKHYNDRIKHMSEAHGITHKFACHICGREYKIKHYLATHIRQTHGHKNKKCTECDMAFITNHGLKKHMLKHTGEKPFTCGICCKSYARNYTLREHMRIHDIDKRST